MVNAMDHFGFVSVDIYKCGSVSDMECFFSVAGMFRGSMEYPDVFLDRLYRRYVTFEQMDLLAKDIPQLRAGFRSLGDVSRVLAQHGWDPGNTRLDAGKQNLEEVFSFYFKALESCIEYKDLYVHGNKEFSLPENRVFDDEQLLRVALTEVPFFDHYIGVPIAIYDSLPSDALPYWRRDQMEILRLSEMPENQARKGAAQIARKAALGFIKPGKPVNFAICLLWGEIGEERRKQITDYIVEKTGGVVSPENVSFDLSRVRDEKGRMPYRCMKSLDTTAKGYVGSPGRIYSKLKSHVDDAAGHGVGEYRGIDGRQYAKSTIELSIPQSTSPEQMGQVERAVEYARSCGVVLHVRKGGPCFPSKA
jgi:hypothetical protein